MAYKYKLMIFSGTQLKYWWSILILEEKLFVFCRGGGLVKLLTNCSIWNFIDNLRNFRSNFFHYIEFFT